MLTASFARVQRDHTLLSTCLYKAYYLVCRFIRCLLLTPELKHASQMNSNNDCRILLNSMAIVTCFMAQKTSCLRERETEADILNIACGMCRQLFLRFTCVLYPYCFYRNDVWV